MRRIDLAGEREATAPGSSNARVKRLAGSAHVVVMEIEAGGVVGRHPAVGAQLFAVVREEHESGSDAGMTVLVVEAESLDL